MRYSLKAAKVASRDPYGTAQYSTMTAKLDSTKNDSLTQLGDTANTPR